jgi:hypothetical protein
VRLLYKQKTIHNDLAQWAGIETMSAGRSRTQADLSTFSPRETILRVGGGYLLALPHEMSF